MVNNAIYPRGYVAPFLARAVDAEQLGDPVITHLYERSLLTPNDEPRVSSWAFRDQVFARFTQLVPDFRAFASLQFEVDSVYGYNLQFLLDTALFILTGKKRSMSVQNWKEICLDHPPRIPQANDALTLQVRDELRTLLVNEQLSSPLVTPIPLWVSREGGFQDLLTTAFILFGRPKQE